MATNPPTAGFIAQLDPNNPIDSDNVEGANNWLQFVQETLKVNQFPTSEDGSAGGWDIACTVKASEVNSLAGISSAQTVQQQIDALNAKIEASVIQIGSIVGWPVSEPVPSKYLTSDTVKPGLGEWWLCDGTLIDGTTYTDLYARIGNTYGGSTASDMLLPDLQGRVLAGRSTSNSRLTGQKQAPNDSAQGNTGGEQLHTPIEGEMFQHNHGGASHDHRFEPRLSGGTEVCLDMTEISTPAASTAVAMPLSGNIVNEQGNNEGFNVTQPTLIMAMYIRVL